MHITIIAYGTWGDVRPSIALGRALQAAGYGVRLIVTEDFARWVTGTGLDVHLLPVNTHHVMQHVSSQTNLLKVMLAIHQHVAPALLAASRDLSACVDDTDALIVNEWLISIASGLAETRHLKLINMAMKPCLKTSSMPICTMPALPEWMPLRQKYNALSYDMARCIRWWSYIRVLNTLRTTLLNLPPLRPGQYADLLDHTPSITLISPSVVPRPADWASHHHLTGFLFYDDDAWRPPAGLIDFIESGPAPVYAGFGSIHDRHPLKTTQVILDALEQANQRTVIYSGWSNLGPVDQLDTVYQLDYAPHSWLFPRMAAVIHHAGAGTSAAALRAGVPSVTVPHAGDQPFWARRLHELGVGAAPLARDRLNPDALAERIVVAVTDPEVNNRAADLSDEIGRDDGAGAAVAAIDKILRET